MKHFSNFNLVILSFLVALVILPCGAAAQRLSNTLPDTQQKEDQQNIKIPHIFSPQFNNKSQGAKLDRLYYDLNVAFWNMGQTGLNFQISMLEHMKSEKFQLTRRVEEFSGDLKKSMSNLNSSYTDLNSLIKTTNEQAGLVGKDLPDTEQAIFKDLWALKMKEFQAKSDSFFKLQNRFLNTYNALVKLVVSQNGRYYYDSNAGAVKFLSMGVFDSYKNTMDELLMVRKNQKSILIDVAPDLRDQISRY